MEESIPSTHSAYATITAVELLLLHTVIKEYAIHAGISPKRNMTLLAMLADRLSCVAQGTHKLLDHFAIQLMTLLGILQSSFCLMAGACSQCQACDMPLTLVIGWHKTSNKSAGLQHTISSCDLDSLWQCLHQNTSPQHGATSLHLLL